MIDFSQIKDIEIQEGYVRHIGILPNQYGEIQGAGTISGADEFCIWRKPFEFPAMTFGISFNHPHSNVEMESIVDYVTNKYGLVQPIGYNASNEERYILPILTEWNLTRDLDDGGLGLRYLGGTLRAYSAYNASEFADFPTKANIVADTEWILSDKATGRIRLYAVPEKYSGGTLASGNLDTHEFVSSLKVAEISGSYYYSDRDYHFSPVQHETDITVEAGNPVITLSRTKGSTAEITNIRTNFDEYKEKYEEAGGSKYSISEYPYLRGIVKLDCKSEMLGINETIGMYIVFSVRR